MHVDLSACVRQMFAELDLDDAVAALTRPVEKSIELTGHVEQPATAPVAGARR